MPAAWGLAQGGGHDGLDGVHPVFCLVEDDGLLTFKHLIGDLHGSQAEFFVDLLTDGGVRVLENLFREHSLSDSGGGEVRKSMNR